MFNLHKDFCYRVEWVGAERQPVLIVDNFLEQPDLLVEFCCHHMAFNAADAFYPGVRMLVPQEYLMAFLNHLKPLILEKFALQEEFIAKMFSAYSMVTTHPSRLKPEQAIPHFDSDKMTDLASVYYLCDEKYGGTSLYKHRNTGFEYINEVRRSIYMDSVLESLHKGDIKREYMDGSNELFEEIYYVPAVYNRLVIYRSTSLHSGKISKDFVFTNNPREGRLTVNTFLRS